MARTAQHLDVIVDHNTVVGDRNVSGPDQPFVQSSTGGTGGSATDRVYVGNNGQTSTVRTSNPRCRKSCNLPASRSLRM